MLYGAISIDVSLVTAFKLSRYAIRTTCSLELYRVPFKLAGFGVGCEKECKRGSRRVYLPDTEAFALSYSPNQFLTSFCIGRYNSEQ